MRGQRREGTKSPRDKQDLQQKYLQQKTEKFHLLSSPDASTSQTERDTQTEKSRVKTGTFILCLVDVKVAYPWYHVTHKLKTSYSSPAQWCLQADLWEFKAKLTYKVSSQPARAAQ